MLLYIYIYIYILYHIWYTIYKLYVRWNVYIYIYPTVIINQQFYHCWDGPAARSKSANFSHAFSCLENTGTDLCWEDPWSGWPETGSHRVLTYIPTHMLTHTLAFYLAYILTFHLAFYLALFWAFYLASCLTIIYCLTFYLAWYLTFYLAFSVTYIHVNGRHVNTTFFLCIVFCTKTALQTLACRLNSCRQTTNTCQPQNDRVLLLPLIKWGSWL